MTISQLLGIDDDTWNTIDICGEGVDWSEPKSPDCLVLKKLGPAPSFEPGYSRFSDGRCTLFAKLERVSHQTGSTDDEFMLDGPTVVIVKVPKGDTACKLKQTQPAQMRSATGIYTTGY